MEACGRGGRLEIVGETRREVRIYFSKECREGWHQNADGEGVRFDVSEIGWSSLEERKGAFQLVHPLNIALAHAIYNPSFWPVLMPFWLPYQSLLGELSAHKFVLMLHPYQSLWPVNGCKSEFIYGPATQHYIDCITLRKTRPERVWQNMA